jgi:hypothetical protein
MGELEKLSCGPQAATVPAAEPGAVRGSHVRAPAPWSARPRFSDVLDGSIGRAAAPTQGLERRLPRRAERLWAELAGEGALPPAAAAEALLAPPFAGLAMLVSVSRERRLRLLHAGEQLAQLGVGPGPIRPCPSTAAGAAVADRLGGLALEAVEAGSPQHMDSDYEADVGGGPPGLLLRAVALPLAPVAARREAGLAVVVVSWRTLLSSAETADLHRELRAAMLWLGGDRAGSAPA